MTRCLDCGLPMSRCICQDVDLPCTLCGVVGCEGECMDDEDDLEPLNFDHQGE